MKRAVLVLVVAAACQADGDDGYPPRPGGGGPIVIGGGGDAGVNDGGSGDASDAGVPVTGRVCILTDLRRPTDCNTLADASRVTVSIGTRTATPSARGNFTILAPLGAFTWRVTGRDFITSVMPFGAETTIPVIDLELYRDLLATNSVTILEQQGSVVVRVRRGLLPLRDITATSVPAANNLAFYDGVSILDWDQDATGTEGVVWLPGVQLGVRPPTLATVTLRPPLPSTAVDIQAVVEDQAITFVTADL